MNRSKLMNKIQVAIMAILAVLVMCSTSWAANYYIDASKGNDGNPGTLSQPWKTLSKANSTLNAGDTVFIRGGTYTGEQIAPDNSGTASNRITYQNYNNEVVTITETASPLVLESRNYITITGTATQNIVATNCDSFLRMGGASHIELAYLTISDMRNWRDSKGFWIGEGSTYNWIHHCTISKFGYYSSSNDFGDMVYIGASPASGNAYNLVENCHIYYGGHIPLKVTGKYNVIRNNYLHNEEWYPTGDPIYGNRTAQVTDYDDNPINGWNLFEGNRFCFTGIPSDATYSDGIQLSNHDCIIRKNMFYACKGNGLKIAPVESAYNCDDNYIYNNVFFDNGRNVSELYQNNIMLRPNEWGFDHTVIKNNIFYETTHTIDIGPGSGSLTNTVKANNWESGDPKFVDAVPAKTTDPFNQNYPDFNLQSKSPCIDNGAFLTKTTSSGNGTRIQVEDAHYFMDGWNFPSYMAVTGDKIQIEGQTQTAQIIDVDYGNNILTIDKSLTWSANQGVSLQYNGSAPDLGAFESSPESSSPSPPENLKIN